MTAIRMENLTRHFGRGKKRVTAADHINLEIAANQVYGFLGPNGAGKTTTIRLLLDLMTPTSGSAYIYDRHVRREHDVLRRVGALVEGAAFYPYLSGHKNLRVIARTHGHYDRQRVDDLLEQVGLAQRAKQRYSKYSLGMKQRLGLAAALLHDPELLILDEPTNGLDPAGIQEMRVFIRDLVDKQGKTVFLSSHMLSEVEQVCDRVAIIDQGKILREGAVHNLLSENPRLRIHATPLDKATAVVKEHWKVWPNGSSSVIVETDYAETPHIVRKLVENDVDVFEITREKQSLEEFFLSVTGQEMNNGV